MRKSWVLCALLGGLAWGQAAPATAPPGQADHDRMEREEAEHAATPQTAASVPATAAVITVDGVCSQPHTAATKGTAAKPASAVKPADTSAAGCKTVITKAEFEQLVKAAIPASNPTAQMKKQLANALPRLIALSNDAKKKGLDKTPQFDELMKIMRMQMLARELDRNLQEEAGKIPDSEIEAYYQKNSQEFEQFTLDRLFVPRAKVDNQPREMEPKAGEAKPSEEEIKAKQAEEKAKQEESQEAMTKLADDLRARAAAGGDFVALQKEAFEAAGMKIDSPTVSLPSVRRNGLPTAHAAVFDLKPGEVSPVINDSGGHYIYKMESKTEEPLDQAKNEIHTKLQSQRYRETMDKLNGSYHADLNPAYFGADAAVAPQQQMPMHRPPGGMAPSSAQPPAANQAPPQPK